MTLFQLVIFLITSSILFAFRVTQHNHFCRGLKHTRYMVEPDSDTDLQSFLAGKTREWTGDASILKRRNQLPSTEYNAGEALRVVLNALQSNDDPQLDHGALVLIKFSCGRMANVAKEMSPSTLGKMIREKFPELIDYRRANFKDAIVDATESKVCQNVEITSWSALTLPADTAENASYDFFLEKESGSDCWKIDAIVRKS